MVGFKGWGGEVGQRDITIIMRLCFLFDHGLWLQTVAEADKISDNMSLKCSTALEFGSSW